MQSAGFGVGGRSTPRPGTGATSGMLDIPASDYQVSVLEVASSSADIDALAKMEIRWKQKLLSRQFGLNAN